MLGNKEVYVGRIENCMKYKNMNENYILVTQAEKEEYDALISDGMHGHILDTVYDFMNMVFGKDQDTDAFWDQILLPCASQAFGYPLEKFNKSKVNLNALLFAFIQNFGLDMDLTGPLELGKSEKPFTKQIKDILGVSKVYGLRNIPYRVLAERYKDYRKNGKNELALNALKIKMSITKYIDDKIDVTALAEIAEILLEEGLIEKAIEKAIECLKYIHPLHSESIKLYCILLRALYEKDSSQEADKYCFKAISALDFHWGQYHPLHSTVYSILAYLLIKHKDNLKQAKDLYNASLICCTRVLGPNHLHTAEVHMDFGRLYLKMNSKEEALSSIEKAYLIYESAMEKCMVPLANAAHQLASILEDQRKFKEAFPYAKKAVELYVTIYGGSNEMYISSMWLAICISYSLLADDTVIDYCKKLLEAYEARQVAKQRNNALDESMQRTKENCVAATILIITRNLSKEDKRKLLKLREEIYAEWQQQLGAVDQKEAQSEPISGKENDANRVVTLSNIEFDEKSRSFLSLFYEEAKQHEGLIQFYKNLISSLCKHYTKTVENTIAKENENYSQALSEKNEE